MKNYKSQSCGFSTLELLIAMTVMTLSMTAVIMVAFGNQSIAIDTELAQRGLYVAQKKLEESASNFLGNFNAISSQALAEHDPIYDTAVSVTDISPCVKRIESQAFWDRDQRNLGNSLSMIVANSAISEALGGDCATTEPSGNWDTPQSIGDISPSDFVGQGTGIGLTYIDGVRYAFLTTNSASNKDFFVIDTSDPFNVNSGDILGIEVGENGLNGIVVAKIDDTPYAFVLNNSNTNQLIVLDISIPTSPNVIASMTLPNMNHVCSPASAPCRSGKSIFYYDKHIYIGTGYLAFGTPLLQNNELHIYDVSIPSAPTWKNSINVNRDINDIVVSQGIAYLATGPGSSAPYTPLRVYNVDPASPDYLNHIESFEISIARKGTSVYKNGNRLYLGLERTASGNNLYIINADNPQYLNQLATTHFGVNNSSVGDLFVSGKFLFAGIIGSNSQNSFQIWDISNLTSLQRINICTSGNPFPQDNTGIRFADNLIFTSFKSNRPFRIFYDSPLVCS